VTALRALFRDRRAAAGMTILALFAVAGIMAPIVAPADPVAQHDILGTRFLPPLTRGSDGLLHWLGTDYLGRDLLSRLLFGARVSLAVGFISVTVSVLLGGLIGVVAAVSGGAIERMLMALTDAALALPRIVLLLALVSLWDTSLVLVILVLGFTGWMTVARLVRAEVKGVLQRPFVEAATAAGARRSRILVRHLVPNSLTPLIVAAALGVGNAIMLEAGLSFLGLGVPAPAPSWGNMIASGRDALVNAPWVATFPGVAVALAVVACNLVGDGARDALDPRTALRRRRSLHAAPAGSVES
jgi:peptide/nickel transport system permease protein